MRVVRVVVDMEAPGTAQTRRLRQAAKKLGNFLDGAASTLSGPHSSYTHSYLVLDSRCSRLETIQAKESDS